MNDTLLRQLAVKAAAIKAVKDAAAQAETATKAALKEHMGAGDRTSARLLQGDDDVATITYSKTSAEAIVTDPRALTAWVLANHPDEIHSPVEVDADDLAWMLGIRVVNTARDAKDYDAACERLSQATIQAPAAIKPAFKKKILADVLKAKAAVDPATGEEIPGVKWFRGGQGLSITVRQTDDQREALIEAYNRGDVDLVELATTPPALEARS
jgi:hypothetical protein